MSVEKQSNNQRGGVRPGSGRKKGQPNKRTAEAQEKAKEAGITPLDYLLSVMTDSSDEKMRMSAAIAAAPYIHAKLSSIEATVEHKGSAFAALLAACNGTAVPIAKDA